MLKLAKKLFPLSNFIEGDFLGPMSHLLNSVDTSKLNDGRVQTGEEGIIPETQTELYDAVVLNACFANIGPDPRAILQRAASLCRSKPRHHDRVQEPLERAATMGGVVVISHQYGSSFCRSLASEDGLVAATALPNRRELEKILESLPTLLLEHFEDGTPYVWEHGKERGIYMAVLRVR